MELTLGKRIAAGRKRAGLTQDKLAEQLGVTAQAVSKWENDLSCPDVTMLPKLAEIFGTTTDALLGVERETVHEAQVVEDGEEIYQDNQVNIHLTHSRRGTIGFALWVLLTGALLLANIILPQLDHHGMIIWPETLPVWDIIWPAGLVAFGLAGLYPEFSFFRLGCALFGGYTLLGYVTGRYFGREALLPIIMIVFGLSLLVDALRKPRKSGFSIHNGSGKVNRNDYTTNGERFDCNTNFGGSTRCVELKRLSAGDASVNFGELIVDLTGCAEIAPDARVHLSCCFGELTVRIPRTCRVEYTDESSFGSVEVKGCPNDDAPDRIFLNCDVSFGQIEIQYV